MSTVRPPNQATPAPELWHIVANMLIIEMLPGFFFNKQKKPLAEHIFPPEQTQIIAEAAQAYFTEHPAALTLYNLDVIAAGSTEDWQYKMLPPPHELRAKLEALSTLLEQMDIDFID